MKIAARVFGSKDKEKEHNPVASFLPLKYKGLKCPHFERLRGIYTGGGEYMKEDASPHFLAGEFLTLTKKKDEK